MRWRYTLTILILAASGFAVRYVAALATGDRFWGSSGGSSVILAFTGIAVPAAIVADLISWRRTASAARSRPESVPRLR